MTAGREGCMSYIVVQHYQFPIRDPFKEGDILTEIEANVLNWHRARLISRIVSRWVTDVIDLSERSDGWNPDDLLSAEEVENLTQRIIEFDENYNLSKAKEPKVSLLEYNLELLASNFLYRNGNGEPSEEDIARIKKAPEIQAKARDLIKSGTFSLSELLG
jgi:hypothetical protein